jgi:hypothetical protein
MKRLLLIIAIALIAVSSFAAQDEHEGHDHEPVHANEGEAHDLGEVSIVDITYRVTLHGEITQGTEAVISIEAEKGQSPKELRTWIGVKNGRGSVKTLLKADSHGHFHGHLEVPAKLVEGSAIWLDVRTDAGRNRGSVSIPEDEHNH